MSPASGSWTSTEIERLIEHLMWVSHALVRSRAVRDENSLEEIVDDVAMETMRSFDPHRSPSWHHLATTILKRRVYDALRRSSRGRVTSLDSGVRGSSDALADSTTSVSRKVRQSEWAAQLRAATETLSEAETQLLLRAHEARDSKAEPMTPSERQALARLKERLRRWPGLSRDLEML